MMKEYAILLLLLVAVCAKGAEPQYTRRDSLRVMAILNEASHREDSSLMLFIARMFLDIPYVGKTLEPNDQERLIVNLRQLDCTTYVETVIALRQCVKKGTLTFRAYCEELQRIRYQGGAAPDYRRRLHYFSLWLDDNTDLGLCHEIQSPNPPFTEVQTVSVNWMTTHIAAYPMLVKNPSWVPAIREMEQSLEGRSYRYIPKSQVRNTRLLRQTIHDGDIIVLTTNKKGLDTQHIGFAVWHADGLHLLNASSIYKKVIEDPMTLRQYLYRHPTMPGIRVARLE